MRTIFSILLTGGLLAGSAFAEDPKEPPSTPVNQPTPTGIPDSYTGVVRELRTQSLAADAAITAGDVGKMRDAARRINELAGGIAGKSDNLSESDRSTIAAAATRVKQKSEEMLNASEKNDMPTAKEAFNAIKTDIDTLAKFGS